MLAPLPAPPACPPPPPSPRGRNLGDLDGSWGKLTKVLRQKQAKLLFAECLLMPGFEQALFILSMILTPLRSYRLRDSLGSSARKLLQSDHPAPALRPWPQAFILKEGQLPHAFTEGMNKIRVRKG